MGDSWGGEGDEDAWVLAVAIYSRRMGGLSVVKKRERGDMDSDSDSGREVVKARLLLRVLESCG